MEELEEWWCPACDYAISIRGQPQEPDEWAPGVAFCPGCRCSFTVSERGVTTYLPSENARWKRVPQANWRELPLQKRVLGVLFLTGFYGFFLGVLVALAVVLFELLRWLGRDGVLTLIAIGLITLTVAAVMSTTAGALTGDSRRCWL
jgi:hypothetical protein